jgi:Heavy metal binding domain
MQRNLKMTTRNLLALSLTLGIAGTIAMADGDAHKDGQTEQIAEGESHGHESPHGGIVKTAGDFHVELVVKPAGSMEHHEGGEAAGHDEGAEHNEANEHGEATEHGEASEHGGEHADKDNEQEASAMQEVWTCTMDTQVRESAAGKCPICGMNLTLAKDGAAHLELYIAGGEDSAAKTIGAETLSAYLQVPGEDGFRNTTLRPAPLEGEEEGSSHFVGMIEPSLATSGFTATLRIPIDGETHRVAFHVKPQKAHEEGHDDDGEAGDHDEAGEHGGAEKNGEEHGNNENEEKVMHH